jgi:ribonuclease HI
MKIFEIFTDGASKGNPGPAGVGVLIRSDGKVVCEVSEAIGTATNNVAEYTALIRGLKEAQKLGAEAIKVRTDSELLFYQLKGEYKVKHPNMKPLHEEALGLLKRFRSVECKVVPREENAHADRLATAALRQKDIASHDGRPDVFFIGEESPSSEG